MPNYQELDFYGRPIARETGQKSFEITAINPDRWEQLLGLGKGQGADRSGEIFLRKMYMELGYKPQEAKQAIQSLRDLIELSKVNRSIKVGDVAQFVKRRAVLGGAAAVGGAFLATSMGDPFTGVAMAVLARYGSSVLTKPAALKALVTVANPEISTKIRRNNYIRLIRLAIDDPDDLPEGLTMNDLKDPETALDFFMGETFSSMVDQDDVGTSEVKEEPVPVSKMMPKINPPATKVPEEHVSKNLSGEVKSKMASASPFIRKPGGATRGKLSEVQRAALAGGDIYGAIAAGNQGGAVYNDGIMNLANRRRV